MNKKNYHLKAIVTLFLAGAFYFSAPAQGSYVTGDFHQHTTYTDGSYTIGHRMEMSNKFGLDRQANSEHETEYPTDEDKAGYTVPSWTLYQRTVTAGTPDKTVLVSKDYPYNVNVTFNGDPTKQFGAAWFTNADVTGGRLQIAEGNTTDFSGAREINAVPTAVHDVNYVTSGSNNDDMISKTGFSRGEKRSYISNKALIDNLKPGATYSYRVGGVNNAWSAVGTFTTAKANKDTFEFIYITDTQANTDNMFDTSAKTVNRALTHVPDAKFLLIAGDLVESSGNSGSEWEWEQWFEKMQNNWFKLPIAPIQGNHDTSPFSNMFYHFNTDTTFNSLQPTDAKTAMNGTVYSFVYGDALFMCINYEDYAKGEPYFAALEAWMRAETAAHSDVKWKIAAYHKAMFTGSSAHQDDRDGRAVRERMAPVFQNLGIDLAIQGHDHIYEVIGVLTAGKDSQNNNVYTHLDDAVEGQGSVTPTFADGTGNCNPSISVTGKEGGTYDVSEGVLYFLNNSAGEKKYYPRSEEQMTASLNSHGVNNYFTLFNKFGQTGEPTYSRVKVSSDTIFIETYTVNKETQEASLFDAFKIVKSGNDGTGTKNVISQSDKLIIYPNPANTGITVKTSEKIENIRVFSITGQETVVQRKDNTVDLSSVGDGIYVLSVKTAGGIYTKQFAVKK